jgi:hypothetical protein
LRRNLSRRITATDRKVLLVQDVGESTFIKLLEVALALFLKEKLGKTCQGSSDL